MSDLHFRIKQGMFQHVWVTLAANLTRNCNKNVFIINFIFHSDFWNTGKKLWVKSHASMSRFHTIVKFRNMTQVFCVSDFVVNISQLAVLTCTFYMTNLDHYFCLSNFQNYIEDDRSNLWQHRESSWPISRGCSVVHWG